MRNETIFQQGQQNKEAELAVGSSFGSSAIFNSKDPPLSVPSLQRGWLYRENRILRVRNINQ
jgi:hypothetical protein